MPRLRRWLLSPWLYAGGAVAALVFLPVLAWNAAHDWISFRFQFGRVTEHAFDDFAGQGLKHSRAFWGLAFIVVGMAVGVGGSLAGMRAERGDRGS